MKKIFTCFISMILITGISICSYASTTISTIGGSSGKDVNATYVSAGEPVSIYNVDVSWGAMEFTYTSAFEGTWNPETHQMDNAVPASWTWADEANIISVANHSNAAIDAELAFASTVTGVTGGFYTETKGTTEVTGSKLALASAVGTTVENAPKSSAYLKIDNGDISAAGKVGTVTVTIRSVEED